MSAAAARSAVARAASRGFARGEAFEIGIGALVIAVLAAFVLSSTIGRGPGVSGGYEVMARFARADGISLGSEVRIAGVVVGHVVAQSLDEFSRAVLVLDLDPALRLDSQASASIATDGLFGEKHIDIEIGGGETDLPPGGEIAFTEPSLLLDDLLELILARGRSNRAQDGGR